MRKKGRHLDYALLIASSILLVLGVLILASSSTLISEQNFDSPNYILFHQIKFGILPGILLGGICFFLPLAFLKKRASIILFVVLILTVLVFAPNIGLSLGGAARWLKLGPISFQPSEFLKLGFILYLAALFSKRENSLLNFSKFSRRKNSLKSLNSSSILPFLVTTALISLILILQPDISTLGIIVLVAILLYFCSNTPLKHTVLLVLIGISGLAALIKLAPYRFNRLLIFLKSGIDPMGIGYQINQSLIAIGSGGILGTGIGMGLQKSGFLPQTISDSIFAVFSEETGLVGSLFLVFLFLIFARQGFKISKRVPDNFLRMTALGISCWIVIQAFINIGSMIELLPLTGIPLPFISYGGSHLIAELMGLGILLNISKKIN